MMSCDLINLLMGIFNSLIGGQKFDGLFQVLECILGIHEICSCLDVLVSTFCSSLPVIKTSKNSLHCCVMVI